MNRDGRKIHWQAAREHDASLDRFDQLRRIAMARVVGAAGIGNTDHGAVERRIGEPCALDESLAQEERKTLVAIACQAFAHARVVRWVTGFER